MNLEFVNLNGEKMSVVEVRQKKARAPGQDSFHKGWKVVGIAPGAYEAAVAENKRQQAVDAKCGSDVRKDIPPYEQWKNSCRLTPVRSKPYEVKEAAYQCAELARKAGWDCVSVVEMKKEKQQ